MPNIPSINTQPPVRSTGGVCLRSRRVGVDRVRHKAPVSAALHLIELRIANAIRFQRVAPPYLETTFTSYIYNTNVNKTSRATPNVNLWFDALLGQPSYSTLRLSCRVIRRTQNAPVSCCQCNETVLFSISAMSCRGEYGLVRQPSKPCDRSRFTRSSAGRRTTATTLAA